MCDYSVVVERRTRARELLLCVVVIRHFNCMLGVCARVQQMCARCLLLAQTMGGGGGLVWGGGGEAHCKSICILTVCEMAHCSLNLLVRFFVSPSVVLLGFLWSGYRQCVAFR